MIRDEEISRLTKYAQALGVTVKIINDRNEDSAYVTLDGTELAINKHCNKTKIQFVLSLIHELGHVLYFIHEKDRTNDITYERAIERETLHEAKKSNTPPKHLREKILNFERASAEWWDTIYKETQCRFPYWKLELARKFDIWQYQVYYKTGKFPKRKDRNIKYKQFKKELGK